MRGFIIRDTLGKIIGKGRQWDTGSYIDWSTDATEAQQEETRLALKARKPIPGATYQKKDKPDTADALREAKGVLAIEDCIDDPKADAPVAEEVIA